MTRRGDVGPGASATDESQHAVSWRVSLPFFGGRYYFALFMGGEQRSAERLCRESQSKSWLHTLLSLSIVTGLVATMLMGTVAAGYLAKSMLGIDLFQDHFFLHGLFFG